MDSVSGEQLWQWRLKARQQAIAAAVPVLELDWFLGAIANLDPLALRLDLFKAQAAIDLAIPFSELDRRWRQRLEERVPVQYLVGTVPWRTFSIAVSPAVLIPRPETELIIDLAVQLADQSALMAGEWADLGTGSGAIALGLATAFPNAQVHAVDVSRAALEVAESNAQRLGLGHRIQFHYGSWFEPIAPLGQLSGVLSNPPYIPTALLSSLQPEVAQHEPRSALDGGLDGLDCIRHLVHTAPDYLRSGGIWITEMMAGQAEAVRALLRDQGSYADLQVHFDLAGLDRFVSARRI